MEKGFTLIEIMLVVVILGILSTLIIPGALRFRMIAIETAAISNIKTISTACQVYRINYSTYPNNLISLSNSTPPYIDSELGSGTRQNYEFLYAFIDENNFTLNANPLAPDPLKGRYFYTDEIGNIHAKPGGPAGPDDEMVR